MVHIVVCTTGPHRKKHALEGLGGELSLSPGSGTSSERSSMAREPDLEYLNIFVGCLLPVRLFHSWACLGAKALVEMMTTYM